MITTVISAVIATWNIHIEERERNNCDRSYDNRTILSYLVKRAPSCAIAAKVAADISNRKLFQHRRR